MKGIRQPARFVEWLDWTDEDWDRAMAEADAKENDDKGHVASPLTLPSDPSDSAVQGGT